MAQMHWGNKSTKFGLPSFSWILSAAALFYPDTPDEMFYKIMGDISRIRLAGKKKKKAQETVATEQGLLLAASHFLSQLNPAHSPASFSWKDKGWSSRWIVHQFQPFWSIRALHRLGASFLMIILEYCIAKEGWKRPNPEKTSLKVVFDLHTRANWEKQRKTFAE